MRSLSPGGKRRPLLFKSTACAFLLSAALTYFTIPFLVFWPAGYLLPESIGKDPRLDHTVQVLPDRDGLSRAPPVLSFLNAGATSLLVDEKPEVEDTFNSQRSGGPNNPITRDEEEPTDLTDKGGEVGLKTTEVALTAGRRDSIEDAGRGDTEKKTTGVSVEARKERYLLFIQHSGLSNQLINIRKAAKLAALYNRTLIVPPLQSSHLKQRPVIIDKGFSDDGAFVDVKVQEPELARPENHIRQWLDIAGAEGAVSFVSLQEYVNRTGQLRYRCWNVREPISLRRVKGFLPWRRAADEEDVLCIGRPYQIGINGRFVADYLRFSETVRKVGNAWLERNGLGPGRRDFIGAHIRRGDFENFYCEKKNFPLKTCNPTYDMMFEQVDDVARRALATPAEERSTTGVVAQPAIPVVVMTNERRKVELARMASRGWLRFSPSHADVRLLVQRGAVLGIGEYAEGGKLPRKPTAGEMSMLTILVDQYLGSQATYFVGNKHSTFTNIIWQFRDCKIPNACEHWGERRIGRVRSAPMGR